MVLIVKVIVLWVYMVMLLIGNATIVQMPVLHAQDLILQTALCVQLIFLKKMVYAKPLVLILTILILFLEHVFYAKDIALLVLNLQLIALLARLIVILTVQHIFVLLNVQMAIMEKIKHRIVLFVIQHVLLVKILQKIYVEDAQALIIYMGLNV